jgi:hypothetical protein
MVSHEAAVAENIARVKWACSFDVEGENLARGRWRGAMCDS